MFFLNKIIHTLFADGMKHIDEIIEMTFEYLGMIRDIGVQQWIHDEGVQMFKIGFRFEVCIKEKE
jgi:insulysin